MKQPLIKKGEKKHTWADYLTWPDEERWEVIDGIAYNMTPSPTAKHQQVAGNLYGILRDKLRGKPCRPFIAPLDVYLDDYNFIQPDVMVVCDGKKIRDRIYGAPDLIIEVLSPTTSLKDKREKKSLYERFGVKEYVIVHPVEMFIERYRLVKGKYKESGILGAEEVLKLSSLEGVEIPMWEVFEVEPPKPEKKQGDEL